jgi:hypothetical protein
MGKPKPLTKWEKFWQQSAAATLLFALAFAMAVAVVLMAILPLVG